MNNPLSGNNNVATDAMIIRQTYKKASMISCYHDSRPIEYTNVAALLPSDCKVQAGQERKHNLEPCTSGD